jgi:hypothetical protein
MECVTPICVIKYRVTYDSHTENLKMYLLHTLVMLQCEHNQCKVLKVEAKHTETRQKQNNRTVRYLMDQTQHEKGCSYGTHKYTIYSIYFRR